MSTAIDRQARRITGMMRRHLAGMREPVPEPDQLYWSIFGALNAARTYHMAGPNPIPASEIEAWARLHRWPLLPHHVEIIRAMDETWMQVAHAKVDASPAIGRQPLSAAMFDAMFS